MKEVLTEELIDDEGDTKQKIKLYSRESDTQHGSFKIFVRKKELRQRHKWWVKMVD